jgi:hypothetical protein
MGTSSCLIFQLDGKNAANPVVSKLEEKGLAKGLKAALDRIGP